MKFQFTREGYQTSAVWAVTKVFKGQPFLDKVTYHRDLGVQKRRDGQINIFDKAFPQTLTCGEMDNLEITGGDFDAMNITAGDFDTRARSILYGDEGFENAQIILDDETLLANVQAVQREKNIRVSDKLVNHLGRVSLDVEMETGTGKTYVYIKTIFELNRDYGWSKFIIVVPSIAIREGVKKSFQMMEEHFFSEFKKKARYFIYNSKDLTRLDAYSSSNDIQVMIINAQAFNARGADARRIDMVLDDFQSRRPIDVIAKNRPILILDEPQKLGGEATQAGLQRFNPLFTLSYSATHRKQNNLVYVLDALDAYNQQLVKKIEVKGFEIKNLRGTDSYLYLAEIVLSKDKPPRARMEFEIKRKDGSIVKEMQTFKVSDNLYIASKELQQYKDGYTISEIDPFSRTVTFTNGAQIQTGQAQGNVQEKDIRRIQIRETIISHLEKERMLRKKEIKVLSLFFIDEVIKYRDYDRDDEKGDYARIFEEEYTNIVNNYIRMDEDQYFVEYLKGIATQDTHKGYFSIDKKSGRMIDSTLGRKETESDDISAYELILKNKERLLSFDEPTRFIFSHSALREGWDNPNVFQICALKHSNNIISRRQEVGRGLRICVNFMGVRVDRNYTSAKFHDVNKLTVIATDSYKDFVAGLQRELKDSLYERPTKVIADYFENKTVKDTSGNSIVITKEEANAILIYMAANGYTDTKGNVTEKYRTDDVAEKLAELPEELQAFTADIHTLIKGIFDPSVLTPTDANETKAPDNKLNDNFWKKEFQALWKQINRKYAYRVEFDDKELVKKTVARLDADDFYVSELKYVLTIGEQRKKMKGDELKKGESFQGSKTETKSLQNAVVTNLRYDLIERIATPTSLTRAVIAEILRKMSPKKFECFKVNPEEFITKAIKIINEEKATMVINDIRYNEVDGKYENEIFTAGASRAEVSKIVKGNKSITDYIVVDGTAADSVEKRFASDLDQAAEVVVYAKLPRGFSIPTPVGDYTPDWAIAFMAGSVKHIYFIAETKGSMNSMDIRPIEVAKLKCAKRLFNELSTNKVRYHEATDYQTLLDVMKAIP